MNVVFRWMMVLVIVALIFVVALYLDRPTPQPLVVTTVDYQIERWYDVDTEVVCYILNARAISCLPVSDTTVMMPR